MSRQALGLATRILDVDRLLPDERLHEVHPELSFQELTGYVLESKKTAIGAQQRLDALSTWRDDVAAAYEQRPESVPTDDALDALACLWTAQRIANGIAHFLPLDVAEVGRITT